MDWTSASSGDYVNSTLDEESILYPVKNSEYVKEELPKLVAKIISDKGISFAHLRKTINNSWGLKKPVTTEYGGFNICVINFQSEEDKEVVWKGRPWNILGKHVLIQKWEDYTANKNGNITTFWVQAFGIPALYMSTAAARKVGNRLGVVNEIILPDAKVKYSDETFCRIRVDWDITKPLMMGTFFLLAPGNKVWIRYKYEKLCHCCYSCGLFDHEEAECNNKNKLQVKLGKWIRAPDTSLDTRKTHNSFPFIFVNHKGKGKLNEFSESRNEPKKASSKFFSSDSVTELGKQDALIEMGQGKEKMVINSTGLQGTTVNKAIPEEKDDFLKLQYNQSLPELVSGNAKMVSSMFKSAEKAGNKEDKASGLKKLSEETTKVGPFVFGPISEKLNLNINPKPNELSPCYFGSLISPKLILEKSPSSGGKQHIVCELKFSEKTKHLPSSKKQEASSSLFTNHSFSPISPLVDQERKNQVLTNEVSINNLLFREISPTLSVRRSGSSIRSSSVEPWKKPNNNGIEARRAKLWEARTRMEEEIKIGNEIKEEKIKSKKGLEMENNMIKSGKKDLLSKTGKVSGVDLDQSQNDQ